MSSKYGCIPPYISGPGCILRPRPDDWERPNPYDRHVISSPYDRWGRPKPSDPFERPDHWW